MISSDLYHYFAKQNQPTNQPKQNKKKAGYGMLTRICNTSMGVLVASLVPGSVRDSVSKEYGREW